MFDKARLQRLYRYCFALTANEDDAYDLLHDAIERFLRAGHAGNSCDDGVDPYLRRIIRNRFIDQYRHGQRAQDVRLTVVELDKSSLESIRLENLMEIEHIWKMLDPVDREILYFWACEDCSTREIAQKMEMPRGTVLSKLNRIQRKVSIMLETSPVASSVSKS